jgi:hypothetical protein
MPVTYDFTGKTALVTGGSAGMGEATVRAFAESGANVAITDLDGEAAQGLADEIAAKGLKSIAIPCDVTDEEQVAAAVRATVDAFGSLGLVLLAILVILRLRRRVVVRLRGLGWRRMAVACGAATVLFYAIWIFYLSGTMPSVTVAYNWNLAWLALDGFEALAALLTAVFLFRGSIYAALSAAAFSTSLCIDALFDVATAAQGAPLVTAVLEAVPVELPFAATSCVLAIKILSSKMASVGPPPG